ncbi:MAG: LysR family transcriptional regulator [Dorea sp.]|nr:LysR family transcriptional regulator [Sporofaciens musculi]MCI9421948.1 LysR family transcriptional regulator [Dorea sp.]
MNKYSIIIKVYEAGSISKAAAQSSYSQSAVSQVIASVENELGFPLFKRLKTGVVLTEEGKMILPAFQNIAREESNIRQMALSITGICEGRISIGAIPGVGRQWLPDIIKGFSVNYPKVSYDLVHGVAEEIQKELCGGRIDCGLTTAFPVSHELKFTPLYEDEFIVLLPAGHFLADREEIGLSEIAGEPLILPDSRLDSSLEDIFIRNHFTPNIYLRGRDEISMLKMIENGLGIGVLSGLGIGGLPISDGVVCRRFQERYVRVVGISVRKNQKQPLLTDKFTEFAGTYIKKAAGC